MIVNQAVLASAMWSTRFHVIVNYTIVSVIVLVGWGEVVRRMTTCFEDVWRSSTFVCGRFFVCGIAAAIGGFAEVRSSRFDVFGVFFGNVFADVFVGLGMVLGMFF